MATETLSPSVRVYSGSTWSTLSSSSTGYAAFGRLSGGAYRGIEISFKTTKATTSEFDFRIPQYITGTNATSNWYTWYYCLSTNKVSGAPNTATGNVVNWTSQSVYGNVGTYATAKNAQLQFSVSGIQTGTTYYLYVYSTGPESGETGDGYINFPSAYNYYLETTSYTITCKNRYYNSSGTLVSTTTEGTKSYNKGAIAKGSDWGVTPPDGYYYNGCTTINSVQINATVFRNFYPNSYTVQYNLNGASGTAPSSTTRYYNETYKLTSTTPTRSGHTFEGWNINSNATSGSASGSTMSASTSILTITYYAIWSRNYYTATVSYDANGGYGAPSS